MAEDLSYKSLEGSLSFSRMAIRAGTIFNGGALVTLIPIAGSIFVSGRNIENENVLHWLLVAAAIYVIGLLLSGITAVIAFHSEFNYTKFHSTNTDKHRISARRFKNVGQFSIAFSFLMFSLGSLLAIYSFSR
jgi:hypothetical protein